MLQWLELLNPLIKIILIYNSTLELLDQLIIYLSLLISHLVEVLYLMH